MMTQIRKQQMTNALSPKKLEQDMSAGFSYQNGHYAIRDSKDLLLEAWG